MRVKYSLVLAAVLASGCGVPNYLDGSISDDIPLDFGAVQILKQGASLRIEYVRPIGDTRSKTCKITIDTEMLDLASGTMIREGLFLDRVVIQRSTADQLDFPKPSGGTLQLHKFQFRDRGAIDGEFDVVFENGKTLGGAFGGRVLSLD